MSLPRLGAGKSNTIGFTPRDITGLALWLDAADLSSIDDSTATPDIDQWNDKSGNGYHLSQSTAAQKPHTGATVNGRNAITFDGTDDLLRRAGAGGIFTGTKGHVFYVFKNDATPQNGIVLGSTDETGTTNFQIIYSPATGGTGGHEVQNRITGSDDEAQGLTAATAGAVELVMISSNGTGYDIRLNGADDGLNIRTGSDSGDWFGDVPNRDSIIVGAAKLSSGEFSFLKGVLCELVYYDNVDLTGDEIGELETYLANKWGVTIP